LFKKKRTNEKLQKKEEKKNSWRMEDGQEPSSTEENEKEHNTPQQSDETPTESSCIQPNSSKFEFEDAIVNHLEVIHLHFLFDTHNNQD
jgi:hypothetical protein